jgi:cell division septation protein DedD
MDESESPSWKGHSFTLLVFGGIVVLCSIFFVLGMLVGRNQGQRIAEMNAAEESGKKTAPQPLPDTQSLGFFKQTTEPNPDDTLQPRPAPPATVEGSVPLTPPGASAAASPEPEPAAELKPPAANKHFLQILATKDPKAATEAVDKVQSKGFRALTLLPKPGDKDAWHRVQVGPYDTVAEADMARKELEAQGYKDVILK